MSCATRPTLLKIGITLLIFHDLLVIGLCALCGALGSVALVLVSRGTGEKGATLAAIGGVVAVILIGAIGFAMMSLVACAMAWRGSRPWIQVFLCVALVNGIAFAPNPIGILGAVFCVLGGLEHLDNERRREMIDEPSVAGRGTVPSISASAEE